jgi:uncharacterized membrane protein YbhN (UPF0104 family)
VLLGVLVAVVLLAPGLGDARSLLDDAAPGWLAAAVVLEVMSCWSYVLGFRRVFCPHMSWRSASEISWAELGVGSIVPASGAGGLAFGAWILSRQGMPADEIARRSVAFFVLKSLANFLGVAVIGLLLAIGLVGPRQPLWLTAIPAAVATMAILAVAALGRRELPATPGGAAPRRRRWWAAARRSLFGGVHTAGELITSPMVIAGSLGYWVFDNAVLWATFHAIGVTPPLTVILMGYLIGQLGGALPLPGGIGGIDGGLIGTLIVYGAAASPTVAAVVAYRLILFWVPLLGGAVAFVSLRRGLTDPSRPDLCLTPTTLATISALPRGPASR